MSEEEQNTESQDTSHEFDKKLQQVQQDSANYKRRSESLEDQVADLRDQLSAVPDVPTQSEESLDTYEQVEQSKKDVASLEERLTKSESLLRNQESIINNINQKADYEKQLSTLDARYGAETRNGAIAMATKQCKEAGYTLEGTDHPPYKDLMAVVRESYIHEYYQNRDKKVVEKHTSDNGLGGAGYIDLGDVIPEGSTEEVLAAMRKARS